CRALARRPAAAGAALDVTTRHSLRVGPAARHRPGLSADGVRGAADDFVAATFGQGARGDRRVGDAAHALHVLPVGGGAGAVSPVAGGRAGGGHGAHVAHVVAAARRILAAGARGNRRPEADDGAAATAWTFTVLSDQRRHVRIERGDEIGGLIGTSGLAADA